MAFCFIKLVVRTTTTHMFAFHVRFFDFVVAERDLYLLK